MQNQQKWEGSQLGLTKKVISVFWGIWKDHNERRMGGKGKPREILKTSLHLVEEYHVANEVRQEDAQGARPVITWRPPTRE